MDVINTRTSTMLFGSGFAAIGLWTQEYQFVLGSIPVMIGAAFWQDTKRLLKAFDRIPHATQVLLFGTITLLSIIHFFVLPADAAFLSTACGLLNEVFSSSGAAVNPVKITINIIRAMFIIYLAIALIQVFNAMRQDEDWQMAVRAPVLAILVIVIVDVISQLVVEGGAGSC
ncbi:MAG: hypothetical protein MH252_06020 [Thermosynechococcaceae cyanobacterium MS004]|nr:hypothetical protein [Thermosynechococcaceae cyanobacterium MS004]